MQQEYNNIAEWYGAPTGWLRVYIRVFYVQEINSDFSFQEQICIDAFNQIFRETDFSKYYSLSDAIKAINNRYMMSFDDITFMIAYRFLEGKGFKYQLPGANVVRNEDNAERLAKQYQSI